jgi:hypothetical protein
MVVSFCLVDLGILVMKSMEMFPISIRELVGVATNLLGVGALP